MASPQKENGHTRIANELLEVLAKTKLNGTQRRILDIVIRYTYGFQRISHEISLTFISEATGMGKLQIKRELDTLIQNNIVKIYEPSTYTKPKKIGFNKDYDSWLINTQYSKKTTVTEIDNTQYSKKTTGEYSKKTTKKERTKENYKEIYDYYMSLDLKKHRAYTDDMRKAIETAMKNNKYDIEYCKTLLERHRDTVQATKKSNYPVEARGLSVFFGQKAHGAKHLICSDYEEGGKYYEKYCKVEKSNISTETRFVDITEQVMGSE